MSCVFAVAFGALITVLLAIAVLRYIRLTRTLSEYCRVCSDINNGIFNRRFRCRVSQKSLETLADLLNHYVSLMQQVSAEKIQVERAQKLMISNISHDLRTPLTSILGYLQALQTDRSLSESEKRDFLSIVLRKSENLYELLESFFELSKLDAQVHGPEPVRIHVNESVENALSLFYGDFVAQGIEPVIRLPDTAAYAWGDQGHLQRILANLLSNALRHGLGANRIGVEVRSSGEEVEVSVWDDGCGIEPDELPFIFDRLYVTEASRKRSSDGNGLGLAIAKRLAESLGGSIDVRSHPGVLTKFTVRLKRA